MKLICQRSVVVLFSIWFSRNNLLACLSFSSRKFALVVHLKKCDWPLFFRETQREARSLPLWCLGNPPRVTCRRMNISARNLPLVNRTVMCAHAQLPNQLCLPTLPTWDKCENRTCAAKRDFWKNDRWKGQVRNCPSWSFSTTTTSHCPRDCCLAPRAVSRFCRTTKASLRPQSWTASQPTFTTSCLSFSHQKILVIIFDVWGSYQLMLHRLLQHSVCTSAKWGDYVCSRLWKLTLCPAFYYEVFRWISIADFDYPIVQCFPSFLTCATIQKEIIICSTQWWAQQCALTFGICIF